MKIRYKLSEWLFLYVSATYKLMDNNNDAAFRGPTSWDDEI